MVAAVRDDPGRRLGLASRFYDDRPGCASIRSYRRAEMAFMRWQVRRGLLAAPDAPRPGSAWWRAVNEGLLRDAWEADRLLAGRPGPASRPSVSRWSGFLQRPSAVTWYRAHNASIVAGYIGRGLEYLFAPIGFNWQISLALVPGLAAREVAVGALGTVYSLSATDDQLAGALTPMIASTWSLATALSLLAWYVFAPQCLSTLAVVKRETNSWLYPLLMAGYLFALAYVASFITYRVAVALTG